MPIQEWSDNILVCELQDDPGFTDEVNSLLDAVASRPDANVVLNFGSVTFLNSSNIAKLLKLRKQLIGNHRKLKLCGISTHVWGVFLVTGLDKILEFADDVASGLASLQLNQ